MPDEVSEKAEAEKSAGIYAWEYFRYHANQRQAVFRFYLTFIAAATIAYGYSLRGSNGAGGSLPNDRFGIGVGILYVVASFLFWRLDKRSQSLIKMAEVALKNREQKLATLINDNSIRLMHDGDKKTAHFPFSFFETFRQIYALIFLLIGIVGVFMIQEPFLHIGQKVGSWFS